MFIRFIAGLKRIHLIGNSIWFFLVREICLMPAPYLDGYRFLQMEWWLVGKDMDIGTREKLSYIRKLLKYSIKLTRYLRRIKPDYGMTNTVVFPHLAISCKMLG